MKKYISRRNFVGKSMAAVTGITILPGKLISGLGHAVSGDNQGISRVGEGGLADVGSNLSQQPVDMIAIKPSSIIELHSVNETVKGRYALTHPVVYTSEKEINRLLVTFDFPENFPKRTAYARLTGSCKATGDGASPFLLLRGLEKNGTSDHAGEYLRLLINESEPLVVATLQKDHDGQFGFFSITRFVDKIIGKNPGSIRFIVEVPGFPGKYGIKNVPESNPELAGIKESPSIYQQVAVSNLKLEILDADPFYEIDEIMRPLWETDGVFRESVLIVRRDGRFEDGVLLFPPGKIVDVRDSSLRIRYEEGMDYEMTKEGIRLKPGTSAPYGLSTEMFPDDPVNRPGESSRPLLAGGHILLSESYYKPRQLTITYESDQKNWIGPKFVQRPDLLPKTVAKLAAGEPLKIIVSGDSVTRGGSASGYTGSLPFQPSWSYLMAEFLEKNTGSDIEITNAAGLLSSPSFFVNTKSDLIILQSVSPAGLRYFLPIIEMVRRAKRHTEFIILLPLQTNPKAVDINPFLQYLSELRKMEQPGLAVADTWSIHGEMLKRKNYADMTGNNFNHPNDFLLRVIAQSVVYLFFPVKR